MENIQVLGSFKRNIQKCCIFINIFCLNRGILGPGVFADDIKRLNRKFHILETTFIGTSYSFSSQSLHNTYHIAHENVK